MKRPPTNGKRSKHLKQIFTEFTELFSVHCYTGRQLNTSYALQYSNSMYVYGTYMPMQSIETLKNTAIHTLVLNCVRVIPLHFKLPNLVYSFLNKETKNSVISFIITPLRIYVPQAKILEAFSLIKITIELIQYCYIAIAKATSFLCSSYGHP